MEAVRLSNSQLAALNRRRSAPDLEGDLRTQLERAGLTDGLIPTNRDAPQFHLKPPGCRNPFRFDFAYPQRMLAIEVEGGSWVGGAHSRGKVFERDCVKYNYAVLQGWRILRFTTDMITDGRALDTIRRALAAALN